MPEDRYLLILSNKGYTPGDRFRVIDVFRNSLPVSERLNVRIGYNHIELDIYAEDIEIVKKKLVKMGYKIIDYIKLDEEEKYSINDLCRLLRDERYWESHEILEEIWRENRSESIRWIIRVLVALIKIQMNQPDIAENIRSEILGKDIPKNNPISDIIDVECIYKKIKYEWIPISIADCCKEESMEEGTT